jgi:tRNA (cytidine56-2'-O)-methyltransferase
MILAGDKDAQVITSISRVVENWGGDFQVVHREDWQRTIQDFDGIKVHLSMYGLPVDDVMDEIRTRTAETGLLVVVGAEKVPGKVYEIVDYNVSITGQPHSEISSLAWIGSSRERSWDPGSRGRGARSSPGRGENG